MRLELRSQALAALFVLSSLAACGGGGGGGEAGGGGGVVIGGAPNLLAYSPNPIVAVVDQPLTPATPSVNGTVDGYSIAPALPAGLVLDPATGVISGMATGGSSPLTTYTVTATNAHGSDSLGVLVRVLAPPVLTNYATNPASYQVGQAIAPNAPIVSGVVTGYAIAPSLPAGLVLDATSGVISGTPGAAQALTTYTVTASNGDGMDTAPLSIEVTDPAPFALSSDRPLVRAELVPSLGLTPPFGGLASSDPLLATTPSAPPGASGAGLVPSGAPLPPGSGSAASGTGASAFDATSPFTASIALSGTPPVAWTPACTVLPPFGALACALAGFPFPRSEMAAGTLQVEVFDQAQPANSELSTTLPVRHYRIEQITNLADGGNDTLLSLFTNLSDGRMVFRAHNTQTAVKLFVYDGRGATATLFQLSNLRQSQNISDGIGSLPGLFTHAGKLYFGGDDGPSGGLNKLYCFDPATNSMRRLSNTFPGGPDRPDEFASLGATLYFVARNDQDRRKLYSYVESPAPAITQVAQINPSTKDDGQSSLTPLGGKLYFAAFADSLASMRKLFVLDPVAGTVTKVANVAGTETDQPEGLFVHQGSLYFTARTGASAVARKLFRYDPATNALTQVTNTAGAAADDLVREPTSYNGKLFFTAAANAAGTLRKLYAYEPTGGGTLLKISDIAGAAGNDDPQFLTLYGDALYFRANRTGNFSKLFSWNDHSATLRQVSNTMGSPTASDDPRSLMVYADKLWFSAWASLASARLFAYDAADDSLVRVSDTHQSATLTDSPQPVLVNDGKLFFTALDDEAHIKLFALCDQGTGCDLP